MNVICKHCEFECVLPDEEPKVKSLEYLSPLIKATNHMFSHKDKGYGLDTGLNECFDERYLGST